MPLHNLTRFPRLEFIGAPTPLEYLPRFSDYLGREIFINRRKLFNQRQSFVAGSVQYPD